MFPLLRYGGAIQPDITHIRLPNAIWLYGVVEWLVTWIRLRGLCIRLSRQKPISLSEQCSQVDALNYQCYNVDGGALAGWNNLDC